MKTLSGVGSWLSVVFAVICLGVPARAAEVDLVPSTAGWRRLPGTAEASSPDPAAWRFPGFADASWASGVLPLFYGEDLQRCSGQKDAFLWAG